MKQLHGLLRKGLDQTDSLWPDVRVAFAWVHRAAHILKNAEERSAPEVVRSMRCLLGAMARHQEQAGTLAPALKRFLKVTRSYWPGLFHCYAVVGLPRTNN
ncbi:MAG: ISNCY family transposase, partial [Gemmatimonadetes bacterium]|nr:ISNCY family transposase [Gemmatimonadota bacterium]